MLFRPDFIIDQEKVGTFFKQNALPMRPEEKRGQNNLSWGRKRGQNDLLAVLLFQESITRNPFSRLFTGHPTLDAMVGVWHGACSRSGPPRCPNQADRIWHPWSTSLLLLESRHRMKPA